MEIRVPMLPQTDGRIDSNLDFLMGLCTDLVAILVSLINLPVSVTSRSFIFVSVKKQDDTWELISHESLNLTQPIVGICSTKQEYIL